MNWIDKYENILKAQGIKYIRFKELIFREYNNIIIPQGPILISKPAEPISGKDIFKKLKGKLYWFSYVLKNEIEQKDDLWYAVVKTKHLEINDYKSSNIRNQIRKGISGCLITQITSDYLSENGYAIYKEATRKFYKKSLIDLNQFVNFINPLKDFESEIQIWGVFIKNELVGYSIIYCYDKIEANISEIRMLPCANKKYASYALFHKLSEAYLKERNFDCISDGYRNLVHETMIQKLLINKFGFKRVYLNLRMEIRPPFNLIMKVLFPFRKFIHYSSFKAVFQLIKIAKNQKKLPK